MTATLWLLKASDGDCIFVSCGPSGASFNILIDAGRSPTAITLKAFIESLPIVDRHIDLFVVSHIDADHIAGALAIGADETLKTMIKSIWFNGAVHLAETNVPMSTSQGDDLTKLIAENKWRWNEHAEGHAICSDRTDPILVSTAPLVSLTVLGPTREALEKLAAVWPLPMPPKPERDDVVVMGDETVVSVGELLQSDYERDTTIPNGSSIALLLECDHKRLLIAADSHAETLTAVIDQRFGGKLTVDVATLPHHGSKRNMSPELAERIETSIWTVSTEGHQKHHFPNGEAIARILAYRDLGTPVELVFNSRHSEAAAWDHEENKSYYCYTTRYAEADAKWIHVDL